MPTMVRDLLMLNQRLMLVLTLMPMLGMDTTDMASDHTDTEPMDMDTLTDTDTMARGMLMLSQRLMLRLMPTMDTTDTDSDHTDTMDTELDTMDIHTDTD